VEVLAKEHFIFSRPSVLSSDPITVSVSDTMAHFAPHVNPLPPAEGARDRHRSGKQRWDGGIDHEQRGQELLRGQAQLFAIGFASLPIARSR
jgi:hypothetical protein